MWEKLIFSLVLVVHVVLAQEVEWKYRVQYDMPFNLSCSRSESNKIPTTGRTLRWILPNGDLIEPSSTNHDRVMVHHDAQLIQIKKLDDVDFGHYFCLIYDAREGKYSLIKKGINIDGPFWGDLGAKYRESIIIGSVAAAVVFVGMLGCCYLFERNPVLMGRDSQQMGTYSESQGIKQKQLEAQVYDNAAMELENNIKKTEISNGTHQHIYTSLDADVNNIPVKIDTSEIRSSPPPSPDIYQRVNRPTPPPSPKVPVVLKSTPPTTRVSLNVNDVLTVEDGQVTTPL